MPDFGPDLDNPALFEKRAGVPILDVHTRGERHVDAERLRLVAANSNRRAAVGDPALILLGHTEDGKPETEQPPLAGYARNYQVGQHAGRPCLLADFFLRKDRPEAFEYPRRSVEVYYSDSNPESNYIDSVALLKRSPERDLGLLTYQKRGTVLERYSMADAPDAPSMTEADIPALVSYMKQNGIPASDVARGVSSFLRARADGSDRPGPDSFEKGDIEKMAKWAQANKIEISQPDQYKAALERYKAARNRGELQKY